MSLILSGKLQALLDRLTQARAERLDVDVSSRAPQSSALSTGTWTGAKAAFLDAKISEMATVVPTVLGGVNDPARNGLLVHAVDFADTVSDSSTTASVWHVIKSITGSGVLDFVGIEQSANATDKNIDARFLIDGSVVWSITAGWQLAADDDEGFALIGGVTATGEGVAFGRVPYKTSWSLEWQNTEGAGSVTMGGFFRYNED